MIHEDVLARLEVRLRHEEDAVEAAHAHDGLVDEVWTVGGGHHEDALLGAVVQHTKERGDLWRDVTFLAVSVGVGGDKLQLVETQHKRSFDFGGIKHPLKVVKHTLLINMAHLHALDDGVVKPQLFGEALKDETLAASGRAIEQHSIDGRQFVQLGFLRVLQGEEHLLAQLFLELVATRHIVEAASRAFLEGDDWGFVVLLLLFLLLSIGFALFHLLRQFGHHLLHQVLCKLSRRAETVFGVLGHGLHQDGFHVIGQLHLIGFQDEILLPRFLHCIGNLFLVAVKQPQIHVLPRRLAKHQEIKQRTRREDVALHRVDGAEGLGSTEIRHQVLVGEGRAAFHHVGDMSQVDDGGHQHAVVQFLQHDIRWTYIVVYQCTGMDERQSTQHTQRDLHGVLEVEAAFIPHGVIERYAAIELRDEIMVDGIALFHLAVVDIADHVGVVVAVEFLTELNLVYLLALEELFARDALELVDLHEIHHVVGAEHRIRLSHSAFLYERVDDILANLLPFLECLHSEKFIGQSSR